jgi:uncharacterized protein YpmB
MRDHTKSRKNKNINLWVAKESKKVLVKDGVSTSSRVEERGVKVSISQKYSDSPG